MFLMICLGERVSGRKMIYPPDRLGNISLANSGGRSTQDGKDLLSNPNAMKPFPAVNSGLNAALFTNEMHPTTAPAMSYL